MSEADHQPASGLDRIADAAPAARARRGRRSPALWQGLSLGLFVLMVSLGLAALSGRDDAGAVHATLGHELAAAIAERRAEPIHAALDEAARRGQLIAATVRGADGTVIAELKGPSPTGSERHLQIDGQVMHQGRPVGLLSVVSVQEGGGSLLARTLLPAFALAGFCALVAWGAGSTLRRRLAPSLSALEGASAVIAQGGRPSLDRITDSLLAPLARALENAAFTLAIRRDEALAREQRLGRIVRAHDEAEWEWWPATGETWYSPRFPELLGYGAHDAFESQFKWRAAIHPDDAGTVRRARDRLVRGELQRTDDPIRLRVRDGTYRWFRLRATADRDPQGGARCVSGTLEDVTRERMTLDALRESEARLFHAVRGSFDGAWDWDLGAGRYFLSPRLSEILGISQAQQPQTHDDLLERVHPDDLARLQHAIDEHFLRRESFDIEYRMRHADGRYLWVRDRGLATRSPNGKVLRFSGSITDITERKLAEEAVVRLAAEKQALLDDVPVAIVYVRDNQIADCNRRCEEIFGYRQSELIGCTMDLFFNSYHELPALLEGAGRNAPQPHAQEAMLMRRDGSPLHAYVSVRQVSTRTSSPEETIWIFSDDTARRRALDAARREEHFSAALVRSMPGVFLLVDARGALRRWNENLQTVTGHGAPDLMGKSALDLFPEVFRPLLRRQARRALTHRDSTFEADLLSAGGEHLTHAFSLYRLDLDGLPHLLCTGLDIRAQKEAERSVLAMNQRLETRVRERTAELLTAMRELESFSYSVSHDLAAPLRGIDGFSRMIEEDYADQLDERGRDYINRIRAGTQRMHRLIDDLLGLARITRNEMNRQMVDLSAMVSEICSELTRSEPERRAEFLIQPSMRVYADANLLRIALDNLLRNAWKFTSRHDGARIEIGCLQHDRELVYFVKDDGAGFDMRYATKLFGPFQRLHSVGEFSGSGIGLAIVNRIVQRHGGRIWAEAEVERGACFFFTLEPAVQ